MSTNLFRKSTEKLPEKPNRYEKYGFFQNPFPKKPSVTVGSPDPRENGTIYLPQLREKEQRKFEELLIPTHDKPQTQPIVFLMDYATRRGRGIGKTAFLYYQRERIMKDLGSEISGGSQVLFSTYVLPLPNGAYRKFWQFCKLITDSLSHDDNPIISMAMWRLRAFSGVIPEDVLNLVGSKPELTIGDDKWLREQKVDVLWGLNTQIRNKLASLGIEGNLVEALTNYGHSPIEFRRHFLGTLSETQWRKSGATILFDDLVKLFAAAGFTRGLVLVDEMEKVIQPQNTQERRDFTDALRYFLVDGQCENARISFFSFFLTIHPYIQEILNPHWEASGLDRFAAMGRELSPEYTVYFDPLDQNSAIPLAQAYLDESRLPSVPKGTLHPFTENAINEALIKSGRLPGKFLILLNNVIERAIYESWDNIDIPQIQQASQIRAHHEADESDITDTLPPAEVDLGKDF